MSDKKGKLTLHDCVEHGDLDKVTRLLDDGCPVNKRDGYRKWTPLHVGAERGHTEIVRVLISHGADVNVKDIDEKTPLHGSADWGKTETVKLLIQHDADVNVKDSLQKTPLHCSARKGYTETVKLLLQHGADVNVKDCLQETPLHDSARSGYTETVKLLLQHGADIDALERWGDTPLMKAESGDHIDTACILRLAKPIQAAHRKFLSSNHDVSTYSSGLAKVKCSTNVTDREGKVTLHDCVRRRDLDKLTRLLNDECPVDGRDEDGWTPLCIGAWLGHTEIVKVLISRGADVNVEDKYGWTPLDYMAYQGNREIVEVLISHGADVNIKDTYGDTPLLKGVCEGHKEIVEVLLKNRAHVNVKDNTGHTPLHRSARSGHTEIVNLLIQHGADIDAVDWRGNTPIMFAKSRGHSDIVDIIKQAKYPGRKIKKAFAGFFGYSSRTRKVTVQRTDDKGQITKVKYESSEVRNVEESLETFESVGEGEEDKVKEQKNSQGHMVQELVTTSAETSSYLTTSEADVCTSPGPSSQLSTSSLQSSATTSLPLSSPQTIDDDVTRCAQALMKAVKRKKQPGKDDSEVGQGQNCLNVPCNHCGGNVIVIKEKTVNNHYHNHYHNCDSTKKQTTCEEVKKDTLKTRDIGVGSAKYGLLHLPQSDDHEKEVEKEYNNYKTAENKETGEEGRDKQSLDFDQIAKPIAHSSSPTTKTTSSSSASSSTTTSATATELRRRLESQAGYMEKMVQSCVAGGGVCQDQSSDLLPLHHGAYVPVNLNLIYQPKHVEVWSARQMNVEKAEVENAEMMPVNSPCTFNYAAKKSSDDEDNEDNTDDDNSEDDKEIQIEHDEEVSDGDQ